MHVYMCMSSTSYYLLLVLVVYQVYIYQGNNIEGIHQQVGTDIMHTLVYIYSIVGPTYYYHGTTTHITIILSISVRYIYLPAALVRSIKSTIVQDLPAAGIVTIV